MTMLREILCDILQKKINEGDVFDKMISLMNSRWSFSTVVRDKLLPDLFQLLVLSALTT